MKLDIILKNALNHPNKVAYFKRVFDRPEWKYTDFNRDFLEPLFQRIEKHKEDVYNEYERQKTQLNVVYEKAKRNKLDFYDAYLNKAIDLNLGISMDEYTKHMLPPIFRTINL